MEVFYITIKALALAGFMGKEQFINIVVIDKYSISFLKQEFLHLYFKLFHFEIFAFTKITRFLSWLFFLHV
jgi:hypothetical protein